MSNVFETDSIILTAGKLSGMKLKLMLIMQCFSLPRTPWLLSPDVQLYFLEQYHMASYVQSR